MFDITEVSDKAKRSGSFDCFINNMLTVPVICMLLMFMAYKKQFILLLVIRNCI